MKANEICDSLSIDINDVLNIYPYGSHIYGNAKPNSDEDYIIVYKKSLLPSGSFKDNAISSKDRYIQGTCYSRGGFIDAINNYQISALECIFLQEDKIIKNTFNFKLNKYNEKEMCKKIVSTASASWHNAVLSYKDDNYTYVKKNIYHALRILDFGFQIKENGKIVNYSSMNDMKVDIYSKEEVNPKDWYDIFIDYSNRLK